MTAALPLPVTVDRRGLVTVNGRRYGHVNRDMRGYDRMGRPAQALTWQWVREDGARSPVRYRTRAEALTALVPATSPDRCPHLSWFDRRDGLTCPACDPLTAAKS